MSAHEITVHNRQRKFHLNLPGLRQWATRALTECLNHAATTHTLLLQLEEIEVSFVSDAVIAAVHRRFMQLEGPTDVITFEHGEILISVQTAAVYAAQYGHSLETELQLYIIHGLLHLNGYDDIKSEDAAMMHQLQDKILKKLGG